EFGVQFDSIADMTAFGVAPALVMYKFTLGTLGSLGWAACFVYCLCAGIRLARFNCNVTVVDKRFFQGLPSPAAAALLAGFVWLSVENKLPESVSGVLPVLAMLITLYAGFTMVSNAPFFSGKAGVNLKSAPFLGIVAGGLLFVLFSSNMSLSLFILFCLYALSGYVYQGYLFFMDRPNPVLPAVVEETESQTEESAEEPKIDAQPSRE
ncbi:MAG TPA: CDP-diacylglycerol--serine O-phosphatidyltransferase, partial [Sutterella sp.]|nr:CDP-diacylglycerol--serine O-phosphatidyltransferase [Sutterella sp.]